GSREGAEGARRAVGALRDPVLERLAAADAADVRADDLRDPAERLAGRAGDVREDDHPRIGEQRIHGIPWFVPEDVEPDPAEAAAGERLVERGAIDDAAARDVDQDRARPH